MDKGFYQLTDTLKDYLRGRDDINTVTLGDLTEVDLNKQTIFPLAHIVVENSTINPNTIDYDLSIYFISVVEMTKGEIRQQIDPFYGTSDIQDVWARMEVAAVETYAQINKGDISKAGFKNTEPPLLTPFKDRWENVLAGWQMSIRITLNHGVTVC
jgi:hypothetical protein